MATTRTRTISHAHLIHLARWSKVEISLSQRGSQIVAELSNNRGIEYVVSTVWCYDDVVRSIARARMAQAGA